MTATLQSNGRKRIRVRLRGVVQGVGFRPFVYNLASRLHLGGYVLNSSAGLLAEAEGAPASVATFVTAIVAEAPPLACIQETETCEIPALGETVFAIRHSTSQSGEFALISPDIATCADCLQEFTDPRNRRYHYPFTNCTNCGPRYTIVRDIPYDRAATTMAVFPLCEDCRQEYEDPTNRRFHAQPNACPVCGPSLSEPIRGSDRQTGRRSDCGSQGLGRLQPGVRRAQRNGDMPASHAQTAQRQAVRSDGAATWRRCERNLRSGRTRTVRRSRSPRHPIVILPRERTSDIPGGCRTGQSDAGRDAAVHAAASPAVRRRGV